MEIDTNVRGGKTKPIQSQSPACGRKCEMRNPKQIRPSLRSLWLIGNEKTKPILKSPNKCKYVVRKDLG